eukprot:SAG11_NODE_14392_length_613_cov_1.906615_1_plen_31_part_01
MRATKVPPLRKATGMHQRAAAVFYKNVWGGG